MLPRLLQRHRSRRGDRGASLTESAAVTTLVAGVLLTVMQASPSNLVNDGVREMTCLVYGPACEGETWTEHDRPDMPEQASGMPFGDVDYSDIDFGTVAGNAPISDHYRNVLHPNMIRTLDAIISTFPIPYGYGCLREGDPGDHGSGRACDFMVAPGGHPTPENRAIGQAISDFAVANAQELGVQYVIWEQRIWNINRASEGWRLMGDRGDPTQNHFDHPHVSVQP